VIRATLASLLALMNKITWYGPTRGTARNAPGDRQSTSLGATTRARHGQTPLTAPVITAVGAKSHDEAAI
jgi:hypothetical protein